MSKTYFRVPCFSDNSRGGAKWAKRQASRRVRKEMKISNGGGYRKIYCSYEIHDFKWPFYYEKEAIRMKEDSGASLNGRINHVMKKRSIMKRELFDRESIRKN